MFQVADEIIFDDEITFVDIDDRREVIHVHDEWPLAVPHGGAVFLIRDPAHFRQWFAFGDFLDGVIELTPGDKIERARGEYAALRIDRDVRADHADHELRVSSFHCLGDFHIVAERGRTRVQHGQFEIASSSRYIVNPETTGWGIDQATAFD